MKKYTAALFAVLFLAGCAQQQAAPVVNPPVVDQTSQTSSPQQAAVVLQRVIPIPSKNQITISNYAFDPATITVKRGTVITWINNDSVPHKVISDSPAFESGDILQGDTYSFTFSTAGTYAYHCQIHPSMTGTVVVSP